MPDLSERFMSIKQYVQEGGTRCINCGKSTLLAQPLEIDDSEAWRDVSCNSCNYEWIEVFRLANVEAANK